MQTEIQISKIAGSTGSLANQVSLRILLLLGHMVHQWHHICLHSLGSAQ
jgi:hypothetical protein